MKRFRIKEKEDIKATISSNNKLLASLYDNGFTTIKSIESALLRKIPYFGGKKLDITIVNLSKEESKHYSINVNK